MTNVDEPDSTTGADRPSSTKGPPVFRMAFASYLLTWLAFPPVGIAWLAWAAPAPLIVLAMVPAWGTSFPYRKLYVAGLLYWLSTFYFIPIPHPALWAGWLAVSLYMACYTPLTMLTMRMLIHRSGIPAWIAAPVAWTGIEWLRCHFASGMGMVCLSHSQYQSPWLIQIADLSGAYTLTAVMVLVISGVVTSISRSWPSQPTAKSPRPSRSSARWIHCAIPAAMAVVAIVATVGYGGYQLAGADRPPAADSPRLRIALVQTSDDAIFRPFTSEEIESRVATRTILTQQALRQPTGLVVWPESGMSPFSDLLSDYGTEFTAAAAALNLADYWRAAMTVDGSQLRPTPLLTGAGTSDPAKDQFFNAAILLNDQGQVSDRYFKNHLVMFGEYVPLADQFEWIQSLSPLRNVTAGTGFKTMTLNGIRIAPSLCFETTVPHLIRRQMNQLQASDGDPDVMINLTNDGWFFGTSCLDLHLACNVFRAVEMRKQHLVCANTGLSANIDAFGRLQQVGPRRATSVLHAEVLRRPHFSPYRQIGDLFPGGCGAVVLLTLGWSGWSRRHNRRAIRSGRTNNGLGA